MRLLRARDDEQARRVAVEAVNDAGPVGILAAGRPTEQPVDESASSPPGSWVDDHPGGLVDDEQVLVLEGDSERDVLVLERLRRTLRLELECLSPGQAVALRPLRAVDGDPA
jgi:hypothetical protein